MNQQISESKIIEILNALGLVHKKRVGQWIKCQCPFPNHNDSNPSAGVNVNTGVVNCFGCHGSKHLISVVMDSFNCDYKSAIKMLNINIESSEMPLSHNLGQRKSNVSIEEEVVEIERDFVSIPINLDKYLYTKSRGFTEGFCKEFGIELALSGWYSDYMIIPIYYDGIEAFEARKIMEYEYLCKYFNVEEGSFKRLKNRYNKLKEEDRITLNEYSFYLNKPKTLYPTGSRIKKTLWNYENLNFDEVLYLVEGLGSVPKIYNNISKNVTCIFGSKISEDQLLLLMKFKKVIVIPDNDEAGLRLMMKLNDNLTNVYVKNIMSEDTDESYINDILQIEEIKSSRFLIKKVFGERK